MHNPALPITLHRSTLMQSFVERRPIALPNVKRPWEFLQGTIQSIQLEDGSGWNFNVQIHDQTGTPVWTFVRTIAD